MKRLSLILLLLSLPLFLRAQNIYDRYSTYEITNKENKLGEILSCESGFAIIFGYTNFQLVDYASSSKMYTMHGFNYDGDYIFSIWGPLGLDFNWIGLNAGFGNFNGEFASQMSWNMGLLPILQFRLSDDFSLRAFAGVKGYMSFLMDGTDSFPLTTLSDNVDSIGKTFWATSNVGIDLMFGKFGVRASYCKGLSTRLRKSYYEANALSPSAFDPRYNMLNVSLFWFAD